MSSVIYLISWVLILFSLTGVIKISEELAAFIFREVTQRVGMWLQRGRPKMHSVY
jgi:hypothetical protein